MRAAIGSAAAMGLAAALLLGVPSAHGHEAHDRAAAQPSRVQASDPAACRVVTMAQPSNAQFGTVMDIESVPGIGTVYYGSYELVEADGSWGRHPVVWYGLDAEPVPVGPAGMVDGVAFELTPSGYINGQSIDADGVERAWVQSLRSGRLTWVETPAEAEWVYVRRINDRADAFGTVWWSEFEARAMRWSPNPERPGTEMPTADFPFAEGWDITNAGRMIGSTAAYVEEFDAVVYNGTIWSRDGAMTHLASNPGVTADTYPRLLNERGEAAGVAWYGDWFEGHYEAARWTADNELQSLGLLPGGGFSGIYGQSEGGWAAGVADRFDPEHPAAWNGAVDHTVLWTDESDHVRVLPSPYAIANGQDDWRDWLGGVAHGVHSGLDQVGSTSHTGWLEDGSPLLDAVVYVNASQCGERLATTHTAFWQEPASAGMSAMTDASRSTGTVGTRPAAYDHDALQAALRER